MKHPKVTRKLLLYVKKGNWWQRLLSYKTLGKLGDKTSKIDGKDSVDLLMGRLKELKPVEDKKLQEETPKVNKEIEELIWTLGWLRDARAENLANKKRLEAGQNSLLWEKTKIPYKWIPISSNHIPNLASAYNIRGIANKEKENFKGAIADFTKAISLDPKYSLTYNNRGNAYNNLKEHQKAIADYTKAISFNPKLSLAYRNRAIIFMQRKQHQLAVYDFRHYLKLQPNSPQANQIQAYIGQHSK